MIRYREALVYLPEYGSWGLSPRRTSRLQRQSAAEGRILPIQSGKKKAFAGEAPASKQHLNDEKSLLGIKK